MTLETILPASGVPLLVLPNARLGEAIGNVLIGWNGSRKARRTISDAMPFIVDAQAVITLVVDPSRDRRHGDEPGAYHGLRRKHLQSYLDEFVFRFNRRTRHAAFRSLLGLAAAPSLQDVGVTGSSDIRLPRGSTWNVDHSLRSVIILWHDRFGISPAAYDA